MSDELITPAIEGIELVSDAPSKRELFAAMAMQGIVGGQTRQSPLDQLRADEIAYQAVKTADALIAELAKTSKPDFGYRESDEF